MATFCRDSRDVQVQSIVSQISQTMCMNTHMRELFLLTEELQGGSISIVAVKIGIDANESFIVEIQAKIHNN